MNKLVLFVVVGMATLCSLASAGDILTECENEIKWAETKAKACYEVCPTEELEALIGTYGNCEYWHSPQNEAAIRELVAFGKEITQVKSWDGQCKSFNEVTDEWTRLFGKLQEKGTQDTFRKFCDSEFWDVKGFTERIVGFYTKMTDRKTQDCLMGVAKCWSECMTTKNTTLPLGSGVGLAPFITPPCEAAMREAYGNQAKKMRCPGSR